MKNKKYHTVRTIPGSNIKIVERGKIGTTSAQLHDHPLSELGKRKTTTKWQYDNISLKGEV
jgi:hypothetical protein